MPDLAHTKVFDYNYTSVNIKRMCFVSVVARLNIHRQNDYSVCIQWALHDSAHPMEHWKIYTKEESLASVDQESGLA